MARANSPRLAPAGCPPSACGCLATWCLEPWGSQSGSIWETMAHIVPSTLLWASSFLFFYSDFSFCTVFVFLTVLGLFYHNSFLNTIPFCILHGQLYNTVIHRTTHRSRLWKYRSQETLTNKTRPLMQSHSPL